MPFSRGSRDAPLLLALVFCSGCCALVYQIGWQRELRLVFGASTQATAAVLAIFMGGLGVGGAVLGRRVDRCRSALRFYGLLELGVAAGALASPFLFMLVRKAYLATGGSVALGPVGAATVRLALAAAVLGVPTFLMGGTLPAAARGAESPDGYRRVTALLYGVNTFGALCGAVATTFLLLERLGTRATILCAGVLNLAVGAAAVWVASRGRAAGGVAVPGAREPEPDAGSDDAPGAPPAFVYAAAAITGFAFFLMEIVWYRMLAPLLGGTTYTFGLILAVALAGMGAGGALSSLQGRRGRPTVGLFAATCGLEALGVALAFGLGDRVALLAQSLRPEGDASLAVFTAGWTLVCAVVVLPGALIAGYQFPLLISLLGRGAAGLGRHTGVVYLWNTAGAIVGALLGGFGLLPALGALGCWRLAAALLAALCLASALVSRRSERQWTQLASALAAAGAAVLLTAAPGPTAVWRHSAIGAGLAAIPAGRVGREAWARDIRFGIGREWEGIESSVGLYRKEGLGFVVNGKVDGNAKLDAGTQVMAPLVGAILHPRPASAMVIGLGTGSSAGWLAAIDTVRRVDVAELEPAIVEVARACAPVNHDVLASPKLRLMLGDARELLMTSRERYDIVLSEPSNPYRAGIASLYTREFYRAVADRLAPGGIFLQWVQAYSIDADTVGRIAATLASEFGDVELWQTAPSDLLFVCSAGPKDYSVPALAARLQREPFRSGLLAGWGLEGVEGFLSGFFATDAFARHALGKWGERGLNTDDRSPVEFGFVRALGSNPFMLPVFREETRARGAHRPAARGGTVDWARVELGQMLTLVWQPSFGMIDEAPAAGVYKAYKDADPATVRRRWEEGRWQPSGALESFLLAQALVQAGDPRLPAILPGFATTWPAAAATLESARLLRAGDPERAVVALERSLAGFRATPWEPWDAVGRAIATAEDIAAVRPALAPRLYRALEQPLSVSILEWERIRALVMISALLDPGHGERALALFEPHFPYIESLLQYRADCYARAGSALAGPARRDVERFRRDSAADAAAAQAGSAGR